MAHGWQAVEHTNKSNREIHMQLLERIKDLEHGRRLHWLWINPCGWGGGGGVG